ncbi:MAG TPA: glycosyl hydrolase family 18 protein, partial [Flavitalea sp.]|nr:glycosyl hydrolase family 18 protein [Flavitalea sp.]
MRIRLPMFLFCLILSPAILTSQTTPKPNVIAYYTGHYKTIGNYDLKNITHIIFGFCRLTDNRITVAGKNDSSTIKKLVSLRKQYPQLKILLALGGWGGCKTCSEVFSTQNGRSAFATSAVSLLNYFDADGLDLDWEYPSIPGYPGHQWTVNDKSNFTSLLKEIRMSFQNDKEHDRNKELSFAAGAYRECLERSVDWKNASAFVDRIHLMTYDLRSSRHSKTGHHAPLFSTNSQEESADYAVKYLMRAGVPPSKIVIGAAFYGRIFKVVDSANNGLFQPGRFTRFILFKKLRPMLDKEGGFMSFYDSAAEAAYGFNAQRKEFVSFEDFKSVRAKAAYVLNRRLNGIMFWEQSQDYVSNGFLNAITSQINS